MTKALATRPVEQIESAILFIRGERVILDSDLARLYGVTTTRLNQQVRRNLQRFPSDFMFQLTRKEYDGLMLQIATSKSRGGRRKLPLVLQNTAQSWPRMFSTAKKRFKLAYRS